MGRLYAVLVSVLVASALPAAAQSTAERQALASQIEQRFDVLLLQGGVALKPKTAGSEIRSIEVTGGAIALDGNIVSGAELRQRLPMDADVIIRLSYLAPSEQRALFESSQPAAVPPVEPVEPTEPTASGEPAPPVRPGAPRAPRRAGRSNDRVRIGGGVEVGADEIIDGDVVAIGGDVKIDGQVRGDVVAIMGNLDLGPGAEVERDVVVVGGALRRNPTSRVGGEIREVGIGGVNLSPGEWGVSGGQWPFIFGNPFGSAFALISTITRLAVLCILASIVLLFGSAYIDRVSLRAANEPVKAGAVGFLIQLLFLPVLIATILVMVITIIGIPLLVLVPFAVLAFAVLFLIGFTAVVYDIGRLAAGRFGWDAQNPYLVASIGIALVLSPVLLSRLVGFGGMLLTPITWTLLILGFVAEYVAWTVGLGAVALVRFDRK